MSDSYISPEQQSDWANGLLESLNDTTSSNSSVVSWLRSNLGDLNARLHTQFSLSGSGYIVPQFNDIQSGIYNEFFYCYWLRKKARTVIGQMEFDWIEMEGTDQGKIKKVSNKDKSAAYSVMAKDCDSHIKELVKTYNGGDFARPRQITFNDRHSVPKNIGCGCFSWSPYNPINR